MGLLLTMENVKMYDYTKSNEFHHKNALSVYKTVVEDLYNTGKFFIFDEFESVDSSATKWMNGRFGSSRFVFTCSMMKKNHHAILCIPVDACKFGIEVARNSIMFFEDAESNLKDEVVLSAVNDVFGKLFKIPR